MAEPTIEQTVDLGGNQRIAYKSDGKSYLQTMAGGRVISETVVTSSQAQQRVNQSRQTTTPAERLTIDQLKSVIGRIESIKPNAQGRYVYLGETYTEGGLDKLKKTYTDRLKELEDIARRSGEQAAQRQPGTEQEIGRVNKIRTELSQKIQDLKDEQRTVETTGGQNNLRSWVTYYQNQFDRLTKYVDDLSNGATRIGAVDTTFTNVSVEQATARPITGGATAQAGVVYGGVPGAGQAPVAPGAPFVPGAGETPFGATIQPGTMLPEGATPTTPATTPTVTPQPVTPGQTTPGAVTPPSGTRPGTQPSTQPTPAPSGFTPGQQVGGPDRTLPDGGAVVGGVYVPPGIDYTWLGSQLPDDWKQAAKELYGAYYDMIKNDVQISKLLENAIKDSYTPEKFQAELEKTDWWRKTTANARAFQVLETTDPATARAQLDGRMALVRETAQRLGVTLGSESLESIARNAISLGFEIGAQIEDLVGSEAIKTAGGVSQLRYGYLGNSLRESARKYGVALSDVTFNEWLNKIAVGSESTETFESYASQIARTLYPTLSSGFERGLSFAQMTDPYAQVASRILEIPSAQVDFTDPKWAQAFTMKNDKGEQVPMSFGEWADYLRTTPSFGYQYTDEAKSKAYNVVDQLARAFGAA